MAKHSEPDGYQAILAGAKPAKGETAAVAPYLEAGESLVFRQPVDVVGEVDGRTLFDAGGITVVTDRKVVFARTSGGFRPQWEVFTLPFGHLEPGVSADDARVSIPTSGRRSYRVELPDSAAAGQLADHLGQALRAYRRDRMGLDD